MLPTSPAPTFDDFVPPTTSGSGMRRRTAARSANTPRRARAGAPPARRDASRRAPSARPAAAAPATFGPYATSSTAVGGAAKKLASMACAWARSVAAAARSASTSMTSRSARSRSKPGGLARRFAAAQHVGEIAETIAAARQLALAHLGRPQIGEREPQIGPEPPDLRRRRGSAPRRRGRTRRSPRARAGRSTGSTCATITMFSVMPATDSRLNVTRGFGQRAAARTSARATSTAARAACTRGLSAASCARAWDSVSDNVWAPALAGSRAAASAARTTRARIGPRL